VKVKYEHAPRQQSEIAKEKVGGHLVQKARELGARAVPRDD
jgi:hypothetical protein